MGLGATATAFLRRKPQCKPVSQRWKTTKATEVAFGIGARRGARQPVQLRVWSTSLFLAIQGIIARNWAPTTSMLCSAVLRRRAVMLG